MNASEQARRLAMEKLEFAGDGAFVIRNSTSRPGSYGKEMHF